MKRTLRHLQAKLGWRHPRPLPHFLVIGTQKGGTTTLHHLLSRHPGIFLPEVKEVHYFSQHFHRSRQWYADHYQLAKPGQVRGDITPFYLFHTAVPERIRSVLPRVSLIALLRDPVERALSQYFHALRHGYEKLDLLSALEAEEQRLSGADEVVRASDGFHYSYQKHSYVSRSCYELQLQRYREWFPKRQLLVLRSEDLFAHTDACWDDLLRFISVAPMALPASLPHSNSGHGESASVPLSLRRDLRQQLAPTYQWIEREYGITWPEP